MRRLVAIAMLFGASAALAGTPVFDAANFGKMVETVRLMQQEVTQLEATYRGMSGSRGLGSVLYNPALRRYLPDDWAGIYDAVAAGAYAGISGRLRDIARAEQLMGTVAEQISRMQRRSRGSAAADKAVGLQAYEGAKARLAQLESLMHEVDRTQDSKGVAEIQARIAIEQAAIANEGTKLQLLSMLQRAEERLAAEQRHEAAQSILDPSNTRMPACCSTR